MEKLTRRQQQVFDAVIACSEPVTAYRLLDVLADQGFKAPPQVYRPLERLVALGLVHKIESKNAYLACQSNTVHDAGDLAYALCDSCEQVTELEIPEILSGLKKTGQASGFVASQTRLEITGLCENCQSG